MEYCFICLFVCCVVFGAKGDRGARMLNIILVEANFLDHIQQPNLSYCY